MSDRRESESEPMTVTRRETLQKVAAFTVAGPALSALLSGRQEVLAAANQCLGLPPEALEQDLTIACAYAASPPALDEVAFTMEVENLLALTYGGDLVQDRTVYDSEFDVCVADLAAPGDEGYIGRWAERWDKSEDGKTWTFYLRKGIKSWAGNEMTAEDIRWTWERGFHMKGVKYFMSTALFLEKPEDVEVVDQYTVRFHLQKPCAIVLKLMSMNYYGGPFDSVEAKKHATSEDPYAKEWLKNHDAGFGPYHVINNIPGQEMVLERNPNYQPRPPIGKIFIKIVPDQATRMALLQRGAVDYAMRLPERALQTLAKDPNIQIVRYTAQFIPFVGPVFTNEIMANKTVRQAMAYAVPYEEIHEKVYFGQGTIIKSITPKIFPNHTPEFWPYHLNLEKARTLLTEAGYPDGFDLKLSYSSAIDEMAEAAVLIKASFDKVGIRTSLDPLPAAVYTERKFKRELMCMVDNFQWPWIADTAYVCWVYLSKPETSNMNTVYFNNAELNDIVTRMAYMQPGPERDKLDRRAQQICGEEVPWIYLVNPGWREAFRKEWTNFHWYPDNNVRFEWLYKEA